MAKHNEIIAVQHYWYENLIGTYETKNEKSTAYVDENNLSVGQYCQACFFGANTASISFQLYTSGFSSSL